MQQSSRLGDGEWQRNKQTCLHTYIPKNITFPAGPLGSQDWLEFGAGLCLCQKNIFII